MTVVDARLTCGCRGIEDIGWLAVGIRFMTDEPCERHAERQFAWCDVDETELAWRDEKRVIQLQNEEQVMDKWERQYEEAKRHGEEPIPIRKFLLANLKPTKDDSDQEVDHYQNLDVIAKLRLDGSYDIQQWIDGEPRFLEGPILSELAEARVIEIAAREQSEAWVEGPVGFLRRVE